MRNKFFNKSGFFAKTTLLVMAMLFSTSFLNAQTLQTFAQFNERIGGNDFVFTNNGTFASFETVAGGSPVTFTYLNVTGLPAELQGPQNARVFVVSSTTAPATTTAGNRTIQPFNSTFTIEILRDTPFNGNRNLLTAVVTQNTTPADLSGDQGSTAAGFSASTPVQNVTFTSSFISFAGSTSRDLGLAFSSVQPIFSLGTTFLSSFTAAGAGTFATNQLPTFQLVPTAATVSVSGQVLAPRGRGLANARVILTDSSGATFSTLTDDFGNYQFSDVVAGETVIIEVKSKLYVFPVQVLNLSEETSGLNFVAQSSKQRIR
jgi:hypothetical protein